MIDLCNLSDVKAWLQGAQTMGDGDDAIINQLITAQSQAILGIINRPFIFSRAYTERRNGIGSTSLMLRNWPVTSFTSLSVDNLTVPAAGAAAVNGYLMDTWDEVPPGSPSQIVMAGGWAFNRGRQNVIASYVAGYLISAEAAVIPASPFKVTVAAPYGPWGAVGAVRDTSGNVFTKVIAAPATGQFQITGRGEYTFAAADTDKSILIDYSYIPADLSHACVSLVSERYKYRSRIGLTSVSQGGQQTSAYSLKDIPDHVRLLLQPYAMVVPC